MADNDQKRPLPHQQVRPSWYLQNLALLGIGTGLGYGAGATAAHLALTRGPAPGILGRMSPEQRQAFFRGAGALIGAGSAFTMAQARSAMEERLHQKRIEQEGAGALAASTQPAPSAPKEASSLLRTMGLR